MALRLPSDYYFKHLTISNDEQIVDIKNIMVGFEIYEDIYAAGWTGKLHIIDGIDLYDNFPIIGGEVIDFSLTTDLDGSSLPTEFDLTKKFIVTGIVDIVRGNTDRSKTYTLNLASPIYFANHETKLSRKYSGNIQDIIKDIYSKALKQTEPLEITETRNSEEIVVPNWTPIRTINYLSKYTQSATDNDASFLFFETKDGFSFRNITCMIKKPPSRTLTMKNTWADGKVIENDPHVIIDLDINETPDILENIPSGLYGSTLYSTDLINKEYKSRTFEYDKTFNTSQHLNKNQLPSWSENQSNFKQYYESSNFLGSNSVNWRLERKSRLNQINAFKLIVKVPNYTKQKVGDVVTLDIKSAAEMIEIGGKEVSHKTLSGNYLIRAIRHIIAQGGYDMILELVKESK